jgi:hypothetical protein
MKRYLLITLLFVIASIGQAATLNLVTTADSWRFAKGTAEASNPISAWRSNTFNDVSFTTAPAPFWYGDVLPGGTQLTDMLNGYLCIFLRKQFIITNIAEIGSMQLGAAVDDGFVAWINGYEVRRVNQPPEPFTINSSVAVAATEPPAFTFYALPQPSLYLDPSGTNVLTIQVFNAGIGSSDLGFDASLTATIDDVSPVVSGQSPLAGSTVQTLNAIQVNFSEDVTGVDPGDLLINGVPATNVLNVAPSSYTFEFSQPPTGSVLVAFAAATGISDGAGNLFTTNFWTYNLNTNAPPSTFYISEFLAANNGNGTNALRDEDGDASDWIEIHNPSASPANIGGWFLTDATNNLTKWRIPNGVTIPGNGYLVVFASGKNRTNNFAKLHSNFSLSAGAPGEYLGLVDPNTNIVSDFYPTYPTPQLQNISYGRDRVDRNISGYFAVPTPGAHNSTGSDPTLDVQFSRTGGTFADSFLLTLTTANTNNIIRYNLITMAQDVNNATNIPTPSSLLYTGAITINNSVQVRARAFPSTPTSFPGVPRTECYTQIAAGITNFESSLPIVIIHTIANTAISGGYPVADNSVMITVMDNNTPSGRASIMDRPQLVKRAGLNRRGSSTQDPSFQKGSYAVELISEFNDDEEASFAGLPPESDWVLYAPNQFDLSLMHNRILHQFGSDFGQYSSRTRFVEVFIRNNNGAITATTNSTGTGMGDYNGVYVLEEKVKRDGSRVDIDVLQPEQTNSAVISGGYLLKVDRTDANERNFSGGGMTITYVEPDGLEMVTPARAPQAAYIKGYLDSMNTGLAGNNLTNIASTNHYSNYIDVDATIDLHLVNVLTMNADGYRLSGYMYKPRGGKLVAGPLWDVDRGLGTSRGDQRTFNPRSWQSFDPSGCGGTDYGTDFFGGSGVNTWIWLQRWFSDVDFWQRWVDRYQNARASVLDSNRVVAVVDGFANEVREAQVREQKRWTGGGASDTSPRNGVVANCTGVFSHTFNGTYQGEIDFQKRWLLEHIHFMDTNLLHRPGLSASQGQVPLGTIITLTNNSPKPGTVLYYTLDGSDPRSFQGRTNPAALLYTGPIVITNNVRIRARAVNLSHSNLIGATPSGPSGTRNPIVSTPWSGDIAATYYVTTPPLVISELMYNPAPPPAGNTNDSDNYEFVELQNIGNTTLNLVGFRFTNGIDFTFVATNGVTNLAPGGRVLIVKHFAAFISRYGNPGNIAGVYGGTLDNGGERLVLVGPRLEPILDFSYQDDWYPLSDGLGFSLVINDPNAPLDSWDEGSSWHSSSFENGSPGTVEPAPIFIPTILVNEALPHTDPPQVDAIELFNPNPTEANIGGWYLTDDPQEPKKYQIPANTTISAGGFALFFESEFGAGPTGFSLGSNGDDLYLFSATNGLLTGFAHGFDFGATSNGLTLGRYVNSQGNEDFTAQLANSLGAPNTLPLVGPVVVSEILYHPPETRSGTNLLDNSLEEFIELRNITLNSVPLFDTQHQTNTWKLSQAVSFDFPTNVTLGPTGYVVVVNFNPVTNAAQVAAFRAKFNVAPSIPLYGPYGGKLDNSSGNVRLSRPDAPNTDGTVPYILVDRVEYEDLAPWPVLADGAGPSLHRFVPSDYGNDPTNWFAAKPSPGVPSASGVAPLVTQQPANATVFAAGGTVTSSNYVAGTTNFIATISGANLLYQWLFNGNAIPGATNATLVLTNIQMTDAGLYSLAAYNSGGAVVTSNATLTVVSPLTIVVQPASQNVAPGATVNLALFATGVGTLRYQWRFEGADIPNATNAAYSFSGANPTLNGNYSCFVQDDLNSILSSNAFIFAPPMFFSLQPTNQDVAPGTNVTLVAGVTGYGNVTYQWRFNGIDIPNATNASYSFTGANLNDHHGNFTCVATDDYTTLSSSNAFIYVLVRPGIVQHLFSQSVLQGSTVTLSLVATGAPPLWYRWIRGGSGFATTSVPALVITNFQATTTFRVGVTNKAVPAGVFSPTSGSIILTLIADGDGDGLGDAWEIAYFGSTNANNAALDTDGDLMSNADEFRSGTNPTNALSVLKVLFTETNANVLSFVAQTNLSYSVQWRPNLAAAPWETLTNLFPSNQVRTITVNSGSAPPGTERYFRVVTPLAP